jgi:hypothetical protein
LPFVCDVLQVPSHDDGGVSLLFSSRFLFFWWRSPRNTHQTQQSKNTNQTHTLFVLRKKNEYRVNKKNIFVWLNEPTERAKFACRNQSLLF